MTEVRWVGTPDFVDGQVMSADGHLNLLGDGLYWLHGANLGFNVPFSGGRIDASGERTDDTVWEWYGAIRHYSGFDNLRIQYAMDIGYTITASVFNDTIAETVVYGPYTTAASNYEGGLEMNDELIDISGLGLTEGDTYQVKIVTNVAYCVIFHVAEVRTELYPTISLPSFEDGDTPTAAQWQDLSDYVDLMYRETHLPRACFTPVAPYGDGNGVYAGRCKRQGRWLGFKIDVDNTDESCGEANIYLVLYVSGSWQKILVRNLQVGGHSCTGDGVIVQGKNVTWKQGDGTGHTFEAHGSDGPPTYAVDLAQTWLFPGGIEKGISRGDEYMIQVDASGCDHVRVRYIMEEPDEDPYAYEWLVKPPLWVANQDTVKGDSGLTNMWKLIQAMLFVKGFVLGHNNAAPNCVGEQDGDGQSCHRKHNFLIYTNASGQTPKLFYYYNETYREAEPGHAIGDPIETEISLPDAYVYNELHWISYDLTGVAGLWPGIRYRLKQVAIAFEDREPLLM